MGTRLLLSMAVVAALLAGCNDGPARIEDVIPMGWIEGIVTVEGEPLAGITVSIAGWTSATTTARSDGSFSFDGLVGGEYLVSLAAIPAAARFETVSQTVEVLARKESTVAFDGTWIRNAVVRGTVTVDGNPRAGATIELSGEVTRTTTTDGNGEYVFEEVRPGDYDVTLTNILDDRVVWDVVSRLATPGLGETAVADFEGYRLIGEISGQVGVGSDEPLAGVRVVITHEGTGETEETFTAQDGSYLFYDLRLGLWNVRIVDGWDESLIVFDETTDDLDLTLADPDQVRVFRGRYRPGSVAGVVTLDGQPTSGANVRLTQGSIETLTATDATGRYVFDEVPVGEPTVAVDLEAATCTFNPRTVEVPPATEAIADFDCASASQPDLAFSLADAQGPSDEVATGSIVRAPLRDDAWVEAGEVEITTGAEGLYFRTGDRLYADAPGSLRFRYLLTAYALSFYALATLDLLEFAGIGSGCALQVSLLDPTGAVLTALTLTTIAERIDVELVPGAVQLRLAFLALTTGACSGAYFAVGSGGLEVPP